MVGIGLAVTVSEAEVLVPTVAYVSNAGVSRRNVFTPLQKRTAWYFSVDYDVCIVISSTNAQRAASAANVALRR